MEGSAATDIHFDLLAVQDGDVVICECGHVGDLDILVDDRGGLWRSMEVWEFDIGVGRAAVEGERCVEGV